MKKLYTILVMALSLSACDNQASDDLLLARPAQQASQKKAISPKAAPHRAVGVWNWVQSTGGFNGGIETPASTGNTVVLKITDHTYTVITNGIPTESYDYTFTMHDSFFSVTPQEMFTFSFHFDDFFWTSYKSYLFIDENRIVIRDESNDGINAYYVRQ